MYIISNLNMSSLIGVDEKETWLEWVRKKMQGKTVKVL